MDTMLDQVELACEVSFTLDSVLDKVEGETDRAHDNDNRERHDAALAHLDRDLPGLCNLPRAFLVPGTGQDASSELDHRPPLVV